jgi:hypothetical protein
MRQFFGEEVRRTELQANLAPFFDLAERIHSFWLAAEKDLWREQSTLPNYVRNCSGLIDIQAIRKFRSVVEECRRGEARNAAIILRSLFETLLVQTFILTPRLAIMVAPDPKSPNKFRACAPSAKHRPAKKDWLSREFRAQLYVTFNVAQANKGMRRLSAGRKRLSKEVDKLQQKAGTEVAAQTLKDIGPEWVSIHKESDSYSGLRVGDLARLLRKDLSAWQQSPYHFQSKDVHAVNYTPYLNLDGGAITARYISTDREVRVVMHEALCIMLTIIFGQQRFVFRNRELLQTLHSFRRSFKALRPV